MVEQFELEDDKQNNLCERCENGTLYLEELYRMGALGGCAKFVMILAVPIFLISLIGFFWTVDGFDEMKHNSGRAEEDLKNWGTVGLFFLFAGLSALMPIFGLLGLAFSRKKAVLLCDNESCGFSRNA